MEWLVKIEFNGKGQQILGFNAREPREIRCASGPAYCAVNIETIPDHEPLAFFRTEIAENESPKGAMPNTPAMFAAPFGKGRVLCSSPHAGQSGGMERWIGKAVRCRAGGK